ncbi:protein RoBo-1-like [Peromyscus leucopus]|uniref:protein RoBo-1-like n=1 Tax=Peromyscus leucopus TaxID=10041 RepID=UPI00188590C6|nr:protein RoBo-1-like [Peromyscus leucopus]
MAWSCSLKSLLTVFVFTIFAVGSVESYQCTVSLCASESCSSATNFCTATKGCFNQIQKFDTPSTVTDLVLKQKGCYPDTCSALTFSATLGDQRRFIYENRCCTTEKCNQEDIIPSSSSEPNGVECTACYNEKEKSCSSVTTLKCTGNEKKCIEVTGLDAQNSSLRLYGKGCATENACDLKMIVLNDVQIQASCIQAVSNNGNPALKSISSAPIILLLLKALL